ncbi:HAD-IIA family hydrolase [Nocardioides sp. LHG3406-4]|uniref:HAD-IIA family hydrolase n=1 Tax=Nocardioides sp. LHG3406-4 TaxID=2804575 RepID=UPI003CEBACAC
MLGESESPLSDGYDLAMFDLDGVVYVGGTAIDGVPERVDRLVAAGVHVAFVTNNASRTAAEVAENLLKLGVHASAEDVVTSAQAAARVLHDRFGTGASILLLGGAGLVGALGDLGLVPVTDLETPDVAAIVSGFGPEVRWKDVMRAAVLIRDGLPWVASNADMTFPTAYGLAPGHGVLVKTLADFSGVQPVVAGKPARPLLDETIRRVGGERPLMVGDRLDTDIEGARNAGVDSLLVMTGVTGLLELLAATPELRPTYISPTTEGLFEPHPAPRMDAGAASLNGWTASVVDGRLTVVGGGSPADWWRVVAVAAWQHLDTTGSPADTSGLSTPGA